MADSDNSERDVSINPTTATTAAATSNRAAVVQPPGPPVESMGMTGTPHGPYPPPHSPYGAQYGPYSPGPMMYQRPGTPYRGMGVRNAPILMAPPPLIPGVPSGLEYLASVNGIVVNQLIEWMEVFTGIETKNRYSLCNQEGQQPVILVHVPYDYCAGFSCFGYNGCCKDQCVVECPPGNQIGRVVQKNSCCRLEFVVEDMSGADMFYISGPICACCCTDHDWPIYDAKRMAQIGSITKEWGGLAKEMYTDADTFHVEFPIDLNVHLKALLLGATFLIDFMKYENNQQGGGQHQYHHRGMYY